MRTADLLTAGLLIAVGVLVVWDALRLGIGWGTAGPKSGFFPFWLAVLMIGCCLVTMAQAAGRARGKPFIRREGVGPVLKVLGPAAGAVLLTHWLGLYVASALYMGTYMRWIGRHSWLATVGLSAAFAAVAFLVFEKWFLVPMPKGPVEAWLGY
jgi:peptidoglycan/LPS O-acetylase OafA/YrhL